jgi:hypothetical protein
MAGMVGTLDAMTDKTETGPLRAEGAFDLTKWGPGSNGAESNEPAPDLR